MRFLYLALLFFTVQFCVAQDSAVVRNFGKTEINIHSAAGLGTQTAACSFEGKPLIKKFSVWFTGLSMGNPNPVAVAGDVFGLNSAWCEGPASLSGNGRLNRNEWPALLQVEKSEVVLHRKNYAQTGYKTPSGFALWPGTFNKPGFPVLLAPYADANLDGVYSANDGDYPYLPGETNVWSMAADSAGKANFHPRGVNIDLSSLWFNLNNTDTTIQHTAFNRLTLCNRSINALQGCRLSLAADFCVGDAGDDYLATDVVNKALLALNADAEDAVFGANPPAAAVGWLSGKVAASMRFEQGSDAVQGAPNSAADFWNLAAGNWKTGTRLGFGGRGLDATGKAAQFIYPGSTDVNAPRNWSEYGEGNNPGRRTGLISTDSFMLNGGQCRVFDAFIAVINDPQDEKNRSLKLQKIHDVYAAQDFTLFASARIKQKTGTAFPNPALSNEPVFLNILPKTEVFMWDMRGRFATKKAGSSGELIFETPGIYLLRAADGSTFKLIIN